uniref:Uncharacterized protein n=1 Tax=Oryza meridionalis TaxID=40149 RepID=A0A0E0EEE3_9ORYZ
MFLPPRELGCTRIRSSEFIGSDFFPFLSMFMLSPDTRVHSSRGRVHGLSSSVLHPTRGQQLIPTIRLKNMLLMTKMKA